MNPESVIFNYVDSLVMSSNISVSRAYLENVVRAALFSSSYSVRMSSSYELCVIASYQNIEVVLAKLSFLRSLCNSEDYE